MFVALTPMKRNVNRGIQGIDPAKSIKILNFNEKMTVLSNWVSLYTDLITLCQYWIFARFKAAHPFLKTLAY